MGWIEAIVYGIVQGLTEFLPISSTAHIRVLPALVGWPDPGAAFTAVIQLGTVLAVLIYFARDLWGALAGWLRGLAGGDRDTPEYRMGWAIFVGSIPIIVLGVVFRHQIKSAELRSLYVVAAALIVMGIAMLVAERLGKQERAISSAGPKDGLLVGLWQAVALIPGMSRSGSTIAGAMFAGFDRPTAARFSFLLSVPSIAGAGLFQLIEERRRILEESLAPTVVATLVSFAVGYAAIAFLIRYLQRRGVGAFAYYRFALAALLLVLLQTGRIQAQQGIQPPQPPAAGAR